ncbi:hypothetical protein ACFLQL_03960 [Verrucomicrobiota bacterium]
MLSVTERRYGAGPFTGNAQRRICRELVDKGTEAIAYACTEVPLALAGQPPSCPFYDTLDVLASACIREAQKEQGSEP